MIEFVGAILGVIFGIAVLIWFAGPLIEGALLAGVDLFWHGSGFGSYSHDDLKRWHIVAMFLLAPGLLICGFVTPLVNVLIVVCIFFYRLPRWIFRIAPHIPSIAIRFPAIVKKWLTETL